MKNQSLISGRWPLLSLISICPFFHKISELFFLLAELSPQQKIWTTVCILQSDVWFRALPFYTAAQWWSTISTVAEWTAWIWAFCPAESQSFKDGDCAVLGEFAPVFLKLQDVFTFQLEPPRLQFLAMADHS